MKILIVEDDPAILIGLEAVLREDYYDVTSSSDGLEAYHLAKNNYYDLIILDIMLPNKSGIDICTDLRKNNINTPILMLTSKNTEFDKIIGFNSGADDYLTKPFSIIELKLRIKAIMRRIGNFSNPSIHQLNDIVVDYDKMDAFRDYKPLSLNIKEFNILKLLINNRGKAVTRETILNEVWGYDSYPTSRTVDNYILSLRKKIEIDPANPNIITTIPTFGYKICK